MHRLSDECRNESSDLLLAAPHVRAEVCYIRGDSASRFGQIEKIVVARIAHYFSSQRETGVIPLECSINFVADAAAQELVCGPSDMESFNPSLLGQKQLEDDP